MTIINQHRLLKYKSKNKIITGFTKKLMTGTADYNYANQIIWGACSYPK